MHRILRASLSSAMILGAVIALSACAPEPEPTPTQTPTASATSTPEPTPTGPVPAFGGDCAAVVDTAEIAAGMGEDMSFWEAAWVDGADAGMGGVRCAWTSDQYLSGFATVWAYPAAVLDPAYVSGDASNSCETEEPFCTISQVFGDTWVGVQVYSDWSAEQIERMRPVLAGIGERVSEYPTPMAGDLAGWWLPVVTCEQLASALSEAGVPSTATDDRPVPGPVFVDGPRARGCTIDVTIQGEQRTATIHLDAGAGGGLDSVLALDPSQRVDVDGRTFAYAGEQYPLDGNPGLILGSDGVNLVSILRGDWDGATALDAPILAAVLSALEA
ncbi:hypothetical protein [Microbacterium sp. NPDC089695]|uniref:hypothetical protein n=1 Tax=Microbacterium sp. NPDC089695 TaxID=3364198 RepID=UPI0037F7E24D